MQNPMQRKTRNSFLLGMLVTLLITGAIIVLLFLQLKGMKEKEIEEAKLLVNVYTINQDVKSGQALTQDMLQIRTVSRTTVPEGATSVQEVVDTWFLQTKEGEQILTDEDGLYIKRVDPADQEGKTPNPNNPADSIIEINKDEDDIYYTYRDGKKIEYPDLKSEDLVLDDKGTGAFIVDKENKDIVVRVYQEEYTDNYYIYELDESSILTNANKSRVKKYIEIDNVPLVAKVNMNANTVITPELVVKSDEVITNDARIEEYNMISLPANLMTNDYVDIRLMTPNGQNYIVISKVLVEVPTNEDGTFVTDTIRLQLREDEILLMSSAIVEAYGIDGAKLYAIKYAEAGTQEAAVVTYVPNTAVQDLIRNNPNIIETAKTELRNRFDAWKGFRDHYLQSTINNQLSYDMNVNSGMNESIVSTEEARKQYLKSLEEAGAVTY